MKNFYLVLAYLMAAAAPLAALGVENSPDLYAAARRSYAAGDYAKAIGGYQRALSLDPKNAGAYIGLGNCYYRLGRKEEAAGYYQKALDLDPDNPRVSAMLAGLKPPSQPTTLSFTVPPAEPAARTKPGQRMELGLIGSLGIPGGAEDGLGFGGRITGGYKLDPATSLLLTLGYLNFNYSQTITQTGGGSTSNSLSASSNTLLECLAGFKWRFGGPLTHPYFLAGAGIADLAYASSSANYVNGALNSSESLNLEGLYPMVEVGGGLEFPLGEDMSLLFQAQFQALLLPSRTSSQKQSGGLFTDTVNNSFFSDVPIELGMNFYL